MALLESCSICDKVLHEENKQVVLMKARGLATFIVKSKARDDSKWLQWVDKSSVAVHEGCRKRYARVNYYPEGNEPTVNACEETLNNDDCSDKFDFKKLCFLCGKAWQDKDSRKVVHEYMTERYHSTAEFREDEWGELVKENLRNVKSLVQENAHYHVKCHSRFMSPLFRNYSDNKVDMIDTLNKIYDYIESNHHEKSPFSWNDLAAVMGEKPLYRSIVYKHLKQRYGPDIYISQGIGKPTRIFYKNFDRNMIKVDWLCNDGTLNESQKNLLIDTVADILREDILHTHHQTEFYKSPDEFLKDLNSEVPLSLIRFLNKLLPTGKNGNSARNINFTKRDAIAHSIISTIHPSSFISHLQLAVGTYIYNKSGSKLIIDLLSKLGVCPTYYNLQLLEASFIMNAPEPTIGDAYVQYIFDNTDHNVATLDGNNTFHNLGGIAVYTPDSEVSFNGECAKLNAMPSPSMLGTKYTITTKPYSDMSGNLMKNIVYKDVNKLFPNTYDRLPHHYAVYLMAHTVSDKKFPVWRGFMENLTQNYSYSVSKIVCLPFITLPPSKPTTINTALHYSIQQAEKLGQKKCFVTFDQPLYIKAREIVANQPNEMKDVIVRLGGFHMLMSFLGAIGHIMEGSGLEQLWSTIYAEQSVPKMLSGHAFSRALRAHILTFTVLGNEICKTITEEEKVRYETFLTEFLADFENNPPEIGDCSYENTIKEMKKNLLEKMEEFKTNGLTCQLWIQYIEMVIIMLQFIEAERIGKWRLHLESVRKMIPFFHASGHFAYAKSAQIYLQDMAELEIVLNDEEFYNFTNKGFFTIRKSDKAWSGVWSDMTIEQTLNRFFGNDLKHGRGVTPSVVARYLMCMPATYNILQQLEEQCGLNSVSSEQHIDCMRSRINRDHEDLEKMRNWVNEHQPFQSRQLLTSLSTGVIGGNNITCHQAEAIGELSMKGIVGIDASMVSLKKNFIVKNMNHAKQGIHIDLKLTCADFSLLFQRISILCQNDEQLLKRSFDYELAPIPLSLFDNSGFMRKTTKSDLYAAFQETPSSTSFLKTCSFVVDGGFLLHHVVWPTSQTFQQIMDLYLLHVINHYSADATIVFDGYSNELIGVKSYERYRRKELNIMATFELSPETLITTTQKKFLNNVCNKYKFVKMLARYLSSKNIKIKEAEEDADAEIVRTALRVRESTRRNVVIVGNDVDLLVILTGLTPTNEIMYFYKISSNKKGNSLFSTENNRDLKDFILFMHAFSGCDSTSSFFGKGKKNFLKIFLKHPDLQQSVQIFNNPETPPDDLCDLSKKIVYKIYGENNMDVPIGLLRYNKYKSSISHAKNEVSLASLPPTLSALKQHTNRVFYQVQKWLGNTIDAANWGWMRIQLMMIPITFTDVPAPKELLSQISCSCHGKCEDKRCSCKKSGLRCNEFCTNCLGISCNNATINIRVDESPAEVDDDNDEFHEDEENDEERSDSEDEENF